MNACILTISLIQFFKLFPYSNVEDPWMRDHTVLLRTRAHIVMVGAVSQSVTDGGNDDDKVSDIRKYCYSIFQGNKRDDDDDDDHL